MYSGIPLGAYVGVPIRISPFIYLAILPGGFPGNPPESRSEILQGFPRDFSMDFSRDTINHQQHISPFQANMAIHIEIVSSTSALYCHATRLVVPCDYLGISSTIITKIFPGIPLGISSRFHQGISLRNFQRFLGGIISSDIPPEISPMICSSQGSTHKFFQGLFQGFLWEFHQEFFSDFLYGSFRGSFEQSFRNSSQESSENFSREPLKIPTSISSSSRTGVPSFLYIFRLTVH